MGTMLTGDNGFDDWETLPGGDNFFDVTDLFPTAALGVNPLPTVSDPDLTAYPGIDPAIPIFAEGYTMHDAMSALEVRRVCTVLLYAIDTPKDR